MDFACIDRLRTVMDLTVHIVKSSFISHLSTSYHYRAGATIICRFPCDSQVIFWRFAASDWLIGRARSLASAALVSRWPFPTVTLRLHLPYCILPCLSASAHPSAPL